VNICVFTLTRRYGGLDVTASCLEGHDVTWLVGDALERRELIRERSPVNADSFDAPRASAGYNAALKIVRDAQFDLLLLLCDYTWVPRDGIQRFVAMAERYPASILTGLCSHSNDPDPSHVVNPEGLCSVFAEPYDGHRPQQIGWQDVRDAEAVRRYGYRCYYEGVDIEWAELNWAAIPKMLLDDDRLVFNEEYDRAFGHENQDFALHAQALGFDVVLDTSNHAIELPHRAYFPQEWAELEVLRKSNHVWHEQRRADAARAGLR
jgi:hypothetical protein